MMTRPNVSVVVCSLNGAHKIANCLAALEAQTIRGQCEIIVVDDGSTDRTAEVARQFNVDVLVHDTNRGLSAARNSGIRRSIAPIVAFTDDDCVPAADWLERLIAEYDDPEVLGVGGTVAPLSTDGRLLRYLDANNPLAPIEVERTKSSSVLHRTLLYLRRNIAATGASGKRDVYSLVGANYSTRRVLLDEIGLFDERITFGGDEEDVCRRLRLRFPYGRFVYLPAAVVHHDFDPRVRDTLRRSYAYGRGSARAFLKNRSQFPTVFPLPIVVAGFAVASVWRRPALGVAIVLPLVAFPRWTIEATRERDLERFAFAYLQLLQEGASDIGFAQSWAKLRRDYALASELA